MCIKIQYVITYCSIGAWTTNFKKCHWNYDFCLINGKLMLTNTCWTTTYTITWYWTTTYTFTWCKVCPRGRGISLQGQNPPRFCPQGGECLDNDIWGRKHCNMQWMEMFEVRRKAHNEFLQELLHSPSLNGRTHVRVLFLNLNNNYIPGTCEEKPDFLGNMMR